MLRDKLRKRIAKVLGNDADDVQNLGINGEVTFRVFDEDGNVKEKVVENL